MADVRRAWVGIWILLFAAVGLWTGAQALDDAPRDESEPVTDSERDIALSTIEASAYFERFVGSKEWSIEVVARGVYASGEESIAVVLAMAEPFDSDGPWLYLTCQGTRSVELSEPFRGITQIGTRVNPDGELIEFRPLMADLLLPHDSHHLSPCPFGLEPPSNN